MKTVFTFFACLVVSVAAMAQNDVRKMKVATDKGVRTYVVKEVKEISFVTESDEPIEYLGHEYVDLGLPSGLLWATCNIGAEKPEDYGDYFAWGEIEPHDYNDSGDPYSWGKYKYGTYNISASPNYGMTKYNNDDEKTKLDLDDDAAKQNWYGNWHMPNISDWEELQENCAWKWTQQEGVKGYKLTSVINGAVLFLPAAGCREGLNRYGDGEYGNYWSSSLNKDDTSETLYLYFDDAEHSMDHDCRYYGYPVRPVCLLPAELDEDE